MNKLTERTWRTYETAGEKWSVISAPHQLFIGNYVRYGARSMQEMVSRCRLAVVIPGRHKRRWIDTIKMERAYSLRLLTG